MSLCSFFFYRFDCNDEEVQSEGDDDDEVNGNDSEDEGVYHKRQHFSKELLIIAINLLYYTDLVIVLSHC